MHQGFERQASHPIRRADWTLYLGHPEKEDPKARPDEIEAQVDLAIELNQEIFWQWYGEATARTTRRSSSAYDFSGDISDCELVQIQFNVHSSCEQHRGAGLELRARFTSDNYAELERRAIAMRGEQ